MTHQPLARKYRPRQFDELVGQQALIRTLKNALTTGKVHPAYIFAGIRGVGKTTVARIFAKGLNCKTGVTAEPCDSCDSCAEVASGHSMDVLEIDGATHTKVEEARDLTQLARYTPARDRYRVFIIDEVHMLSNAAFNALLKTMEEPPPHVVFLLATTEPRKIPDTIHSRAQLFQFRSVPSPLVAEYLGRLGTKEGFSADPGALDLVARCGGGSVRDSLTLLDRLLAYAGGNLTEADAVEILGVAGRENLFALADAFAAGDPGRALALLDEGLERGHDLERLLEDLSDHVRRLLRARFAPGAPTPGDPPGLAERLTGQAGRFSPEDLLRLLDLLATTQLRLKGSPDPRALLELQFVKAALLPKILPLEQILSGAVLPAAARERPTTSQAPSEELTFSSSAAREESAPPPAPVGGSEDPPAGDLRFTAIIPFQRMDESEVRGYEANDSRVDEFRRSAADRFFLAHAVLESAAISLDPEGVLHLVCADGSGGGFAYLQDPTRRGDLEALAKAAGFPGAVSVEQGEREEERPTGRTALKTPGAPTPPERDAAVKNVLRVFGGQIVRVTQLQSHGAANEESVDEPE